MHYLFTYGTLQNISIQKQVFGRTLAGIQDILNGYQISSEKIMGRYLVIEKTNKKESKTEGIVYELHKSELIKVDLYEGKAYKRIKVGLKSGKSAWVYVKA